MGRLTTHVLDAAHGCPGSSIKVELYRVEGSQLELVATALTNSLGVAFATASCGPGEHVTGGGGTFESPLAGDTIVFSRPYANGWRMAMKRGSAEVGKLHAYAMCESFGV